MATTPLWVPLAVAGLAVVGTLAGVVFTQIWNSRLDERRWARESERLRESQAREDVNRTYEHRRAAYVDFMQESDRLTEIYTAPDREPISPPAFNDPAFKGLIDRWAVVRIYGTYEADTLALKCIDLLIRWARQPEGGSLAEDFIEASTDYLSQIRKDLGVPEWKPAG